MEIKNIEDLQKELLNVFSSTSKDKQDLKELAIKTQTASAVIRGLKTMLDYQKYLGIKNEIEFLKIKKDEINKEESI